MAGSIADIRIPSDDWAELYTDTGILAGTPLVLQNKGSTDVLVWIGTKPAASSTDGYLILNYTAKDSNAHEIQEGATEVWLKSAHSGRMVSGVLSVQELPAILPVTHVENEALDKLGQSFEDNPALQPNLKTISQITDAAGRSAMVSMTGELHVAGKVDDVNVNFQYGIRTANTVTESAGTGYTDTFESTGRARVGTGVGSTILRSKTPVRYRAGHEAHAALSCVFDVPEVNVNQYGGFLNSSDTFAVGYKDLDFGIWFIEGGNINFLNQTDFNYDKLDGTGPSTYTINPQMGNLYRLSFTWHGFLPLMLEVADGLNWHKVHTFNFVNQITETHLDNPHLPIGIKIERTAGTGADLKVASGSWRGGSIAFADDDADSDYWVAHTQLDVVLANSTLSNAFTLHNKTTYAGKENHVVYELGVVSFTNNANKSLAVYGNKGATLIGNGAFTDIDTLNSPLQYSNGGTVQVGTGKRGPAAVLNSGADRRTDVLGTGIYIYPGEYFTFEIDPGGAINGTFSISARLVGRH